MKVISHLLPLAVMAIGQEVQVPFTSTKMAMSLDSIPSLGFGTWNLKEANTSDAVSWAIQQGYRHIDAAAIYGNQRAVGQGIADGLAKTGLSREDLWITSKLWNDHHDINRVDIAIDETLRDLQINYLDLYHMHWPVADGIFGGHSIDYRDTWASMTRLVPQGKTRYIGVSNFSPAQLKDLLNHTAYPPSVHQMELHPYLQQDAWLDFHRDHNIHVTAYSPLGGTNPTYDEGDDDDNDDKKNPPPLLKHPEIRSLASKRDCTPAQVVLSWGLSRGTSVIPKSIHRDHITENFASTSCELRKKDLKRINKLSKYHHRYNNPSDSWKVDLYEGLEDADGKHTKGNFTGKAHAGCGENQFQKLWEKLEEYF